MKRSLMVICFFYLTGCSGSDSPSALEKGWDAFSAGNYAEAITILTEAKNDNPQNAEIRAALGWALMRTDQLQSAESEFDAGAQLANPSADLFAGWAFVLNALKDHAASNESIAELTALDPNWIFTYDQKLTYQDLMILKAENHFLLGEFQSALAAVMTVNSSFSADVATDEGRGQLAAEIERLRGDFSKQLKHLNYLF
ncbi:tetratricopeptide repeat protein [bacterium]|nr:tetratricopeptide repeat protein [bacterium]